MMVLLLLLLWQARVLIFVLFGCFGFVFGVVGGGLIFIVSILSFVI